MIPHVLPKLLRLKGQFFKRKHENKVISIFTHQV